LYKQLYILFLIISLGFSNDKLYVKQYFENGKLKAEGWLNNNKKTDYWFFYHENGNKLNEGHYENDKKVKWWIFYDINQNIIKKCEFKNNKMHGYCIVFKNGEIVKGEKYDKGKKVKEWNSLSEFKKNNDLSIND
jgi:antitoxin component YwqK of YwqJK toxin-antitoxin module